MPCFYAYICLIDPILEVIAITILLLNKKNKASLYGFVLAYSEACYL